MLQGCSPTNEFVCTLTCSKGIIAVDIHAGTRIVCDIDGRLKSFYRAANALLHKSSVVGIACAFSGLNVFLVSEILCAHTLGKLMGMMSCWGAY